MYIKLKKLLKILGLKTTHDNTVIAHESDVIVVAVKPAIVSKITSEIAPSFRRDHLLVIYFIKLANCY